jgi:hypothetical protein
LVFPQLLVPHADPLRLLLKLLGVLGQLFVPLLDYALHVHRAVTVVSAHINNEEEHNATNQQHRG